MAFFDWKEANECDIIDHLLYIGALLPAQCTNHKRPEEMELTNPESGSPRWRCPVCKLRQSIRKNASKILQQPSRFAKNCHYIYEWTQNRPRALAAKATGLSTHTCTTYSKLCHQAVSVEIPQIGGVHQIVEISLLHYDRLNYGVHYSRGRVQSATELYTLGAMCNGRIWCLPIFSLTKETVPTPSDITSTLARFIFPGSLIQTDLPITEHDEYKYFAAKHAVEFSYRNFDQKNAERMANAHNDEASLRTDDQSLVAFWQRTKQDIRMQPTGSLRLEAHIFYKLIEKYAFLQRCRADGKDPVEEILLIAANQIEIVKEAPPVVVATCAYHNYCLKESNNKDLIKKPVFVNIFHDERCCASIMEPILPVEKVKEEPEEVIDPLGDCNGSEQVATVKIEEDDDEDGSTFEYRVIDPYAADDESDDHNDDADMCGNNGDGSDADCATEVLDDDSTDSTNENDAIIDGSVIHDGTFAFHHHAKQIIVYDDYSTDSADESAMYNDDVPYNDNDDALFGIIVHAPYDSTFENHELDYSQLHIGSDEIYYHEDVVSAEQCDQVVQLEIERIK